MALAMRVLPLVEPPGVRHSISSRVVSSRLGLARKARRTRSWTRPIRVLGDSKGFKSLSEDGDAGRHPHLAWVLREGQKSATIHAPSEVIWEIPAINPLPQPGIARGWLI